jgi:hypothetical protein
MRELCEWVAGECDVFADHSTLYHHAAQHFDLYNSSRIAPIWLSRVVEGVMRDVMNGEYENDV